VATRRRSGASKDAARPADPVQALVPPVVLGDAEPCDRLRLVDQLRDLLFEGEPGEEIFHAIVERRVGILKWILWCFHGRIMRRGRSPVKVARCRGDRVLLHE
jgi:hypothetical protein